MSFRPAREPTAVALRTLLEADLPERKLRDYLMQIFERTTEDDFETLRDLGLLEKIDPLAGKHRPEPLSRRAATPGSGRCWRPSSPRTSGRSTPGAPPAAS